MFRSYSRSAAPNRTGISAAAHLAKLAAAVFIGAVVAVGAAHAAYPERPIKWIVPSAASGASDAVARIIADELGKRLGQPVVIDNRAGASGAIGLEAIAKSAPDGYTIGTANITNLVLNRQLRPNLPFNPDQDFTFLARVTTQPNLLVVNAGLPVKNVKELVAYAKAHPKTLYYGSSGTGSSMHVAGEYFNQLAGTSLVHVPYKSSPQANTDLISNQIQLMIDNLSTLLPHVQAGRVRALAVTGSRRSDQLPQVPTMAEAGGPNFQMTVWGGVLMPSGAPAPIAKRLADEILAVLSTPAVRARIAALGVDVDPLDPAAFEAFVKQENVRWGTVIRRANIKPE